VTPIQRLKLLLKKDESWAKFRRQMSALWQPEFETQIDEIKTLHLSRSVRSLNKNFPTAKRIAEAAAQDQSVRSRCTEITINAVVVRNNMHVGMTTIQKYLETRYFDTLKSYGVHGVNDRKNLISALINPYQRKYDRVCTLIEISDLVIADLEAASWMIKHTVEALSVAMRRENM
jgi:hypothetical protein